ncbi:S15 peptidase family protein [Halorientalis pallida]|uniref:Twin-arginine translocation signal domain-containing protein n=1 Tax=Halorientalis pallida TaxID=2479928 RepID=A0A498KWU4_9EURY|nr:CocE/NonD family hydrolase [Halorientalis pallida]RXK47232.1 twin-arginine translocation signal domain-containing protein [Halorientalis pallida]
MVDESELLAATRRDVLKYLGAAAGLGVVGSGAIDPFAHPVAALQTDEDAFQSEERRIESFDGTELDTTFYEPTADGPHPAILMTHGWGGSKTDLQPLAEVYASNDFVVLAYTSRGFGQGGDTDGSGGEVNSTSELERQDASALIDYLAQQDAVLTDGEDDPRIGMDGTSYGGGIQLRTASVDDRLDSIVPRATWNNLAQSLAPNGVIKRGWIEALEFGAQTGNVAAENSETTSGILERGRMTEEDRSYYRQRSPVSYDAIEDTPALVIPELTDQLFPINEGVRNFRKLQTDGSQTTLLLGQDGTHILGQPEDYPPGSETSRQFVGQVALQWQEAHLKDGDLDVSTLHYYDESADEFVAAEEFPPHPERSTSGTFAEPVQLGGADGNVASVDIEIEDETEILGLPSLQLDVTPTGDGRSHLFVALQRVRDGEATTIKQRVTPLAVTEAGEIDLELFGVHTHLAAGDRLRVAMSAREDALTSAEVNELFGGSLYRPSDDDAGIEIAGGSEVQLSVPASQELPAAGTVGGTDGGEMDGTEGTESTEGTATDSGMDTTEGTATDSGMDTTEGTATGDGMNGGDGTAGGETEEGTATSESGPGFGISAAIGGAGGLGYLLSQRLGDSEPTEADD